MNSEYVREEWRRSLGIKCHANSRIGRSDRSDVTEYMQYGTFESETQVLRVRRPWSVFIESIELCLPLLVRWISPSIQ